MSTKLKELRVKKVDFVDEGANPKANILLVKRKSSEDSVTDNDIANGQEENLFKKFMKWLRGEGAAMEEIQKEATSFNEQINTVSLEQIRDEIWSVCYALQCSLNSILCDEEMDSSGKQAAMEESLEQFNTAVKGYVQNWATGGTAHIKKNLETPDENDLQMAVTAHGKLGELIEKANSMEGELEDMLKIDKSKMTPEDRAAYDEFIKKYAVETEEKPVEKAKTGKDEGDDDLIDDEDGKKASTKKSVSAENVEGNDDIYKGIHPALAAELENLRKYREAAEERELKEVAKKYAPLGRKPEELVPLLKSLKAAGGNLYDTEIRMLDAELDAINASGLFGEIGKSRTPETGGNSAIAKARTQAAELKKSNPNLTDAQALDQVLLNDPELLKEWDN